MSGRKEKNKARQKVVNMRIEVGQYNRVRFQGRVLKGFALQIAVQMVHLSILHLYLKLRKAVVKS
jgi:hypothetical protein